MKIPVFQVDTLDDDALKMDALKFEDSLYSKEPRGHEFGIEDPTDHVKRNVDDYRLAQRRIETAFDIQQAMGADAPQGRELTEIARQVERRMQCRHLDAGTARTARLLMRDPDRGHADLAALFIEDPQEASRQYDLLHKEGFIRGRNE